MAIERLLGIMTRLRDPARGCPWDLEQDFRSIAPHTIEEAYEVADAIEREDLGALRDELGDLLFQVAFHARLAHERGAFAFDDVVDAICDKLVRRHPHVFGDAVVADAADQTRAWERMKHEERAARGVQGALADVPAGLPALTRARKLGRRAADAGFDWPDAAGPRAKVDEELAELDRAVATGDTAARDAELGDLLFSVLNLARHLEVDPESAPAPGQRPVRAPLPARGARARAARAAGFGGARRIARPPVGGGQGRIPLIQRSPGPFRRHSLAPP